MVETYASPKKAFRSTIALAATILAASVLSFTGAAGAWSFKEAAAPYKGTKIVVLDEVTPLQQSFKKFVPDFTKETGIEVDYQLLNHFEVINKGQADMLSGRGAFDAVMLHSVQMGLLLDAGVLSPIDEFIKDAKLTSPDFDSGDFIKMGWDNAQYGGKVYGMPAWNYNVVYWARNDLLSNADEKAKFKAKYGYELGVAGSMRQLRDNAEFFTRKAGEKLAGTVLKSDMYGLSMEGIKGGTTWITVWESFLRNFGGKIFDANGRPNFDTPENRAGVKFWADLWKFGPPGQAETSLLDVPTLMGKGIVAQSIAWSDFGLGVDQPGNSAFAGKFAYRALPAAKGKEAMRSATTAPSLIAISKKSKNKAATYLFLQWMADKQTRRTFEESLGGGVPVRNSSWQLSAFKNSRLAHLYKAMEQAMKFGRPKPRAPKHFEISDVMSGLMQQVGLGKITAAQATKRGQEAMLRICKKCLID